MKQLKLTRVCQSNTRGITLVAGGATYRWSAVGEIVAVPEDLAERLLAGYPCAAFEEVA